ncbi:MAG TPA: hypothetical protein VG603_15845 [Chitinophagales bacterium]|nr:hypothetical protein [Chitinophagales bacterium]
MKWWNNLKRFFYNRSLNARLTTINLNHSVVNIEGVHSIGIIYDANNSANDVAINQFAENMRTSGKQVEILAFVTDKKMESKPGMALVNGKGVNWVDVPVEEKAFQFANKNFDLLLCCFIGENLSLEYISAISQAQWRVGVFAENKTALYDMMVNMGGQTSLQYFIDQSIYFLSQIKAA